MISVGGETAREPAPKQGHPWEATATNPGGLGGGGGNGEGGERRDSELREKRSCQDLPG